MSDLQELLSSKEHQLQESEESIQHLLDVAMKADNESRKLSGELQNSIDANLKLQNEQHLLKINNNLSRWN